MPPRSATDPEQARGNKIATLEGGFENWCFDQRIPDALTFFIFVIIAASDDITVLVDRQRFKLG